MRSIRVVWLLRGGVLAVAALAVGLLFLGSPGAIATKPACGLPPSGLVSWWPGEGTADDVHGGHDGTLLGGTGFLPGQVGQAFSLDNVDDGVDIPNNGGIFDLVTAWSVEACVKPLSAAADHRNDPIVWKIAGNGGNEDTFFLSFGDNRFITGLERASDGQDMAVGSSPHSLNRWYHVAGTYDGTDLKIYVNGVREGSLTIGPVVAYTGPAPLRIGNLLHSSHGFAGVFDGLIDEVRIYDRALTEAEIRALFGGPVGGIAELPEVAGTPLEAPDSSGSNTGLIAGIVAAIAAGTVTLTGAAWYARRRWAR